MILGQVSHRSSEEVDNSWPSWIPRWHRRYDRDHDPAPLFELLFDSSAQTPFSPDLLAAAQGTELFSMRGFRVSAIDFCSPILTRELACDAIAYLSLLEEVQAMSRKDPNEVGRALIADRSNENKRANGACGEKLQMLVDYIREEGILPSDTTTSNAHTKSLGDYDQAIFAASHNRRFFTTQGGHVGVGPKVGESGDVVVILYGSRAPCVLRRRGEHYKFLGTCYVDGIMDGEAVHQHRAEGRVDELFTLC
jgi:hypothetical protein